MPMGPHHDHIAAAGLDFLQDFFHGIPYFHNDIIRNKRAGGKLAAYILTEFFKTFFYRVKDFLLVGFSKFFPLLFSNNINDQAILVGRYILQNMEYGDPGSITICKAYRAFSERSVA
jgi:hypothetical protein